MIEMVGIYNSHVAKNADIAESALVLMSKVGEVCQLFDDAMLCYSQIGDMSYLGRRSCAFSSTIGKYCSIAWNVSIGPGNHDYDRVTSHAMLYAKRFGMINDISERYYNQYDKETVIGNDVWIGCNAVIMRGVQIGDGAVIGANAVITRDVAPYTIVGGVNKMIKKRFNDDIIQKLLEIKWWDYPIETIKNNIGLIAEKPTIEKLVLLQKKLDNTKA